MELKKEICNSLEFSGVEDYVVIFLSILSYFLRIYLNKQFEYKTLIYIYNIIYNIYIYSFSLCV